MYLTKEEEEMLSGKYGEIISSALKVIVKIGESLGAEKLVEIPHAHVSGLSYMTIGDAGLTFLKSFAERGARVRVFSTVNPIGMDMELWKRMGISEEFSKKQKEIVEAILSMGFEPTFTCTPYLIRKPLFREHLAWGESSAIAMANTYYGARTNREGGPLALMSALTGRTYYAGLHLDENRVPTHELILEEGIQLNDPAFAGALGYVVGEKIRNGIPLIKGAKMSFETVKSYTAAAAASGDIALSYIEGITPDYDWAIGEAEHLEKVPIEKREIEKMISLKGDIEVDAIFVGCPHADMDEVLELYSILSKCGKLRIPIWISTSRSTYEKLKELGVIERLESIGAVVIRDTCPVVSPLIASKFKSVAVTSAKGFFYIPKMHGTQAVIIPFRRIGEIACKKRR
ncbi:MAG: aconitase X catalytic domain-containing protein [Fervidicoccaceae archaeon]